MTGVIVKGIGGFYYVTTEEGVFACRARGIFRLEGETPLVGDRVEISVVNAEKREGSLDKIWPRRSETLRPRAANIDQAAIVVAAKSPAPNRDLIDRLLILAEEQSLGVLLCINKMDLDKKGMAAELVQLYRDAGYPVFPLSVARSEGVDALREALTGKTTILAGPSGVGKSSLVNALAPELGLSTGVLSRKTDRGRHTTRHTELFRLGEDTFLADAPGFSSLSLELVTPEGLQNDFPEIRRVQEPCYYVGCSHTHEPDCAVKAQVGKTIRAERYETYVALYRELSERKPRP